MPDSQVKTSRTHTSREKGFVRHEFPPCRQYGLSYEGSLVKNMFSQLQALEISVNFKKIMFICKCTYCNSVVLF